MEAPPKDYIGYNDLVDEAKRTIVASAMNHVLKHGLNGEHHFYLTFDTRHAGVRIPSYLHARYPTEMGIVIQYKYWSLKVDNNGFSVLLTFDGKPEKLNIPFKSLLMFTDKGMNFTLRFTPIVPDPAKKSNFKPEIYSFPEGKIDINQQSNSNFEINTIKSISDESAEEKPCIDIRSKLKTKQKPKNNLYLENIKQCKLSDNKTKLKQKLEIAKIDYSGNEISKDLKNETAKIIQIDAFRKQK